MAVTVKKTDAVGQKGVEAGYYLVDEKQLSPSRRQRTVARVFAKYGIDILFKDGGLALFRDGGVNLTQEQKDRIGRNVRLCFQELGPTYIKLGQVLATRAELLPEFICSELTLLFDQAPPTPFTKVIEIIEHELPGGMQNFAYFNPQPIGSASLACVYRAQMRGGESVVVKVVRPNVERLFQTDIALTKKLAKRIEKRLPPKLAASVDLMGTLNDYYASSLAETDMRQEFKHMEDFRAMIKGHDHLGIPDVYMQPTKNLLVMQFIDGWSLKDFPVDFLTLEERVELAHNAVHYYLESLMDGYYHADYHASNIIVGRDKKLYSIDFGMVGQVDAGLGERLIEYVAFISGNMQEEAAEIGMTIIQPTEYTDVRKYREKLVSSLTKFGHATQGDLDKNYGSILVESIELGLRYHCRIPSGLSLWAKGFSATESVGRWLVPELNYITSIESFDSNMLDLFMRKRASFRTNGFVLWNAVKLVTQLPRRLNTIIEKLADGAFTTQVEHRLSTGTTNTVNSAVNRGALATLAGSSLVASAGFSIAASHATTIGGGIGPFTMSAASTITGLAGFLFALMTLRRVRKAKVVK